MTDTIAAGPPIERVRHEVRVRALRVERTVRLTPSMLRLTLAGDELADFRSLAFDDHVKLLVDTGAGTVERRDYTPRRFDATARTLVLDFALHEAGPATRWALGATPGDTIRIAGPKGSAVIARTLPRWLLVGDETALPAIGRHIEEADAGVRITSLCAVAGPDERQDFETRADLTTLWAYRPPAAAADPRPLLDRLAALEITPDTFVWVAAEAGVARALRTHLVEHCGHPLSWIKAGGYWVMGEADAHERL